MSYEVAFVSVLFYIHNVRLIRDGEPRMATSTFTQLLSSDIWCWWRSVLFILTLVEHLIHRWTLSAPQWQVWCYSLLLSRSAALQSYATLNEWLALCSAFWISTQVVAVLFSCYMAGSMWNCCCLGTSSVYTIQLCIRLQCHYLKPRL